MSKPFFTAKHFIVMADIIATANTSNKLELASHFADRLQITNPLFKRERFLKACNVEEVDNGTEADRRSPAKAGSV